MNEPKTPRTNEEAGASREGGEDFYVTTDFARQLETELAQVTQQRDAMIEKFEVLARGKDAKTILDEWASKGGFQKDPALGYLQAAIQNAIDAALSRVETLEKALENAKAELIWYLDNTPTTEVDREIIHEIEAALATSTKEQP